MSNSDVLISDALQAFEDIAELFANFLKRKSKENEAIDHIQCAVFATQETIDDMLIQCDSEKALTMYLADCYQNGQPIDYEKWIANEFTNETMQDVLNRTSIDEKVIEHFMEKFPNGSKVDEKMMTEAINHSHKDDLAKSLNENLKGIKEKGREGLVDVYKKNFTQMEYDKFQEVIKTGLFGSNKLEKEDFMIVAALGRQEVEKTFKAVANAYDRTGLLSKAKGGKVALNNEVIDLADFNAKANDIKTIADCHRALNGSGIEVIDKDKQQSKTEEVVNVIESEAANKLATNVDTLAVLSEFAKEDSLLQEEVAGMIDEKIEEIKGDVENIYEDQVNERFGPDIIEDIKGYDLYDQPLVSVERIDEIVNGDQDRVVDFVNVLSNEREKDVEVEGLLEKIGERDDIEEIKEKLGERSVEVIEKAKNSKERVEEKVRDL